MIFISAGHHTKSKGASFEGFNEHDEALLWVKIICELLGQKALFVPVGQLSEKIDFINNEIKSTFKKDNNIAIEIHFNSAMNEDDEHIGEGCETLYYPGSEAGIQLAIPIQFGLSNIFKDRRIKPGYYRMDPKNPPDYFLKKTKCPAVIVEPEFIHRKELIVENRGSACREIVKGINSYFDLLNKD